MYTGYQIEPIVPNGRINALLISIILLYQVISVSVTLTLVQGHNNSRQQKKKKKKKKERKEKKKSRKFFNLLNLVKV